MIDVLLVDDHSLFLIGVAGILSQEQEIRVCGTAISGKEALGFLQHNHVDVVISDIAMPGMNGEELLRQIKNCYPRVKVILLSMYENPKDIVALLKAGADSYLPKCVSKEELLTAILSVFKNQTYYPPRIRQIVFDYSIHGRLGARVEPFDSPDRLTEREKDVLRLIALEYSQNEIARKLFISVNTVVYHKRKLMVLLNVKSVAGLTRKAMEMKLFLDT